MTKLNKTKQITKVYIRFEEGSIKTIEDIFDQNETGTPIIILFGLRRFEEGYKNKKFFEIITEETEE